MRIAKECVNLVKQVDSIAIICHQMPDADALSSAVIVRKIIRQNKDEHSTHKIIDIFVDANQISGPNEAIIKEIPINIQNAKKYDLVITVDCDNISRLGKYQQLFLDATYTINIDHHATNTKFANYNIVMVSSSTCEVLYLLAKSQKLYISDEVCRLVYAGLITDTNNLTSGNITVKTHQIITAFIERGIDIEALNSHFFKNNPKAKALLLKKALSSMKFFIDDRIAFMKLTKQDLLNAEASFEDTMGIVDHGIDIKGVDIAILAINIDEKNIYVSLRSKNTLKVNEIAKLMGGGGHDKAAAFQYNGTLLSLRDKLLPICQQFLTDIPITNYNLFSGDDDD